MITRRELLSQTGAGAVILGLSFLDTEAAEPALRKATSSSDVLAAAKARMQSEAKLGVILVIPANQVLANQMAHGLGSQLGAPSKYPSKGHSLGFRVPDPIGQGDPASQRLFCQAVFCCLPEADVKTTFPGIKANTKALLLDGNGKVIDQVMDAPNLYTKDFSKTMSTFVYGRDGEHLTAMAEQQLNAVGSDAAEAIGKAMENLGARRFSQREAATEVLEKHAGRITAVLAESVRKRPSLEIRRRLERILSNVYAKASEDKPGPRLPFGAEWKQQQFAACPGCGQVAMPAVTRAFLNFYAGKKTNRQGKK